MNVKIFKSKLKGNLVSKPSKSYAHRYLIASALSHNESKISNIDFSKDIIATLDCIHSYGRPHNRNFDKHFVSFSSQSKKNINPIFDCKESGTTLRIFFPIALQKYDIANFIGSDRLIERGIDIYEKIFKYVSFQKSNYSIKTKGTIPPGKYELPGNISSQYISGLLYTLPLLNGDSEICITTELESKNYILMTLNVLKKYGININATPDLLKYIIPGNQQYNASDFIIEGDYSNAAFIDAFNYFDNEINLSGLNADSFQSDKIYKVYFDILSNGYSELDISNCIDLGPILITFAALKNGAKFVNTSRLRIKESDRGNAIAKELMKCNADIQILDNEIIVNKTNLSSPSSILDSHNDHRIAMSLSLLSTKFDIEIGGAECVSKSYPDYFDDIKKLGSIIQK